MAAPNPATSALVPPVPLIRPVPPVPGTTTSTISAIIPPPPPPPTSTQSTTTSSSTLTTPSTTSISTSTTRPQTTPSSTLDSTSTTPVLPLFPQSSTGGIVTVTSVVGTTPTRDVSPSSQAAPNSTSFFQNKGAVAGVFSVLGLVVVVISIALITNAVRRRRALQFDRDVAAAASAAAADASRAPVIDDDDDYNDGYGFPPPRGRGGANPYSYENQAGYGHSGGQPEYTMAEVSRPPSSMYAGHGAGAAGIGTVLSRNKSQGHVFNDGYSQGTAPYPAMYDINRGPLRRSGNGFGPSDPNDGVMPAQTDLAHPSRRISESNQNLLGHSQEGYHSPTQENFAPRFVPDALRPATSAPPANGGMTSDDAYGGYVENSDTQPSRYLPESPIGELPNPYSAPPPRPSRSTNAMPSRQPTFPGVGSPPAQPRVLGQEDQARTSILDQEDYMAPRGTLKVANQ